MEIEAIMPLVDAAIALLEKAILTIQKAFQKGDITVEQQKELMDRITKLKETNFAFTRPEGT